MKESDISHHDDSAEHEDSCEKTESKETQYPNGAPQGFQPGYISPEMANYFNPGFYQGQSVYGTHIPAGMSAQALNPGYYYQPMPGFNPYQNYQLYPQGYVHPNVNPADMNALNHPEGINEKNNPHASVSNDQHADDHGQERIPKHDEHKYGQFMEIVNDVANGNPPDVSKIMEIMRGTDTQFIKGAVVGAVSAFLLTNETVKAGAVNLMAKITNAFGKSE